MKQLLNIAIYVAFIFTAKAQAVGDRITKTAVVIYNNSNSSMSVLLGLSAAQMDTFKIKGKDVWISPVYDHDPVIKIKTNNYVGTYRLKRGNYYMIAWNEKKKYWDIKKTTKR